MLDISDFDWDEYRSSTIDAGVSTAIFSMENKFAFPKVIYFRTNSLYMINIFINSLHVEAVVDNDHGLILGVDKVRSLIDQGGDWRFFKP